jgi:hypothetical protein
LDENKTMDLQFLEFDCSEDGEDVVCWDALAQPAARHSSALLREVAQAADLVPPLEPPQPWRTRRRRGLGL